MNMNLDLEDLNLSDIGIWPLPIRIFLMVLLVIAIGASSFFLDISKRHEELLALEKKHKDLRKEFETKSKQAAMLPLYVQQLEEVRKRLGSFLSQLPNKTEVPNLLEDISKTGKSVGLEFKLFRPQPERQLDFYFELPIDISVVGGYHQIGEFISKISNLPRIVTFHEFTLGLPKDDKKSGAGTNSAPSDFLELNILAKTYRYQEY